MLWPVLPTSFHQFEFIRHSRQLHALLHVASLSSILPSIIAVVIVATAPPTLPTPPSPPPTPPARQRVLFLASTMKGRIDCPLESNPPSTFIQWIKDGRPMEVSSAGRVKVNAEGHLSIKTVVAADEGAYSCVAYSPLRPRVESPSVTVWVRGKTPGDQFGCIIEYLSVSVSLPLSVFMFYTCLLFICFSISLNACLLLCLYFWAVIFSLLYLTA